MSDGAIVALVVATKRPELIDRLVCVAGVFHLSGWAAGVIDPEMPTPDFMVESYAGMSPGGREHAPVVRAKLDQMHLEGLTLTTHDLSEITCRALIMVGDDDEIQLEHTLDLYRSLPNGELAIVPGTSHGLLVEKPELCNAIPG